MKISKREKNLLKLLGVLILLFGSYQFVYRPQTSALAEKKMLLESKQQEELSTQARLLQEISLEKEKEQLIQKQKNLAARYFGNLEQEEILALLNYYNEGDLLNLSNYRFDTPVDFSEAGDHSAYRVTLDFRGSDRDLERYLGRIDDMDRMIQIENLRLLPQDDYLLEGSMRLSFHGLPTVNGYNESFVFFDHFQSDDPKEPDAQMFAPQRQEEVDMPGQEEDQAPVVVVQEEKRTIEAFEGDHFFVVPEPRSIQVKTERTTAAYAGAYARKTTFQSLDPLTGFTFHLVFDGHFPQVEGFWDQVNLYVKENSQLPLRYTLVIKDAQGQERALALEQVRQGEYWSEYATAWPQDLQGVSIVHRFIVESDGAGTGEVVIDSMQVTRSVSP